MMIKEILAIATIVGMGVLPLITINALLGAQKRTKLVLPKFNLNNVRFIKFA